MCDPEKASRADWQAQSSWRDANHNITRAQRHAHLFMKGQCP